MNRNMNICPASYGNGTMCEDEPHPASRFALCVAHWRKIVEDWCADQPAVQLDCPACRTATIIDSIDLPNARCGACGTDFAAPGMLLELPQIAAAREADLRRPGIVYYMRFGDRIKIGFTTDLRARALNVPNDEVVAAQPGTMRDERDLHQRFADILVEGQNEWFHNNADLEAHMASVRAQHGVPVLAERAR